MHDRKFDAADLPRGRRSVGDLGMAAYVKIHGFRCLGRRGRNYYFAVDEAQSQEFNKLTVDYVNSAMHEFDSAIMSLKKIGEFVDGPE